MYEDTIKADEIFKLFNFSKVFCVWDVLKAFQIGNLHRNRGHFIIIGCGGRLDVEAAEREAGAAAAVGGHAAAGAHGAGGAARAAGRHDDAAAEGQEAAAASGGKFIFAQCIAIIVTLVVHTIYKYKVTH